jgi:hypothetical protein
MASFTVESGKRYRARIRLGFFEGVASNRTIADKLEEAGFVNVVVTGGGRDRVAEGTWPGATTSADMPDQIKSVDVIG